MADPAAPPPPPSSKGFLSDLDPSTRRLLAEMMVGEAGGEGPRGMQAVMQVALNRAQMSGQSLEEVLNTKNAFTSVDFGGRGGSRGRLDSMSDADLAAAYSVISKPNPAWDLPPNITNFYNPDLQRHMSSLDPADYHGTPEWAKGKPALQIGRHAFYAGDYKGGPQMADASGGGSLTGNPKLDAALTAALPSPKLTKVMQGAAEKNIEAEVANEPAVIKANEAQGALDEQAGNQILEFMKKNEDIQARMAASNEKLIDALPDEHKLRQQELAKVSDQPMDPTRVLGQFLPMLAILGGAFTKAGAVGSLKAAASAMQAAKGNDQEALKRAHDEFQDQLTEVMDRASLLHQELSDALASSKGNMQDYLNAVHLIAAKYQIPALNQAVYHGSAQDAMGVSDGLLKTVMMLTEFNKSQLSQQQAALNIKSKEQALAAGELSPESDDYMSELGRFGNIPGAPRVPSNLGLGVGPMRHQIIETMTKNSMTQWGTDDPKLAAIADIGVAVGMKAKSDGLVNLGKQIPPLKAYVNGLENIGGLLKTAAGGKGAGDLWGPWWNKPVRMLEAQGGGDPNVVKLNALAKAVQDEYAKVLSGATGSVRAASDSEIKQMKDIVSGDMTPAQIYGVLDTMKQETSARLNGYESAFTSTQNDITAAAEKKASAGGEDAPEAAQPAADADPLGIL